MELHHHLHGAPTPASTPAGLPDDQRQKAFATLQARAALRQATLIQIEGDDGRPQYIVTKWALTKSFDHLDDVESLLDRMEGKAA